MIVHKDVYTTFYLDFASYFFNKVLKPGEGRTATGRNPKLKSESLWSATREKNGVYNYVIEQIIGKHDDWRIYYRTLYLYESKPGTNKRVLPNGYQIIDGYVIANALKAMGNNIPENIEKQIKSELSRANEKEADNIIGEILLHSYIHSKKSSLIPLLKEDYYDFLNQELKIRHELPIHHNILPNRIPSLAGLAQKQVEDLISDYLLFITCPCLVDEGFALWHPDARQQKWLNDVKKFSATFEDYWEVNQVHTWDFIFSITGSNTASAKIKLFFNVGIFIQGRSFAIREFDELYHNINTSIMGVGINLGNKHRSEQWWNYVQHKMASRFCLFDVEFYYSNSRWYFHKFTPIQLAM